MDGLMLFGLIGFIYSLIKCFNKATDAEIKIHKMYCDKVEDQQRNMYTLSESHQLIMERVRLQDMELTDDFVPMEQELALQKWYNKVYHYNCKYFKSLNVIEEGQKQGDNKVVNLAERTQPVYGENTKHEPED